VRLKAVRVMAGVLMAAGPLLWTPTAAAAADATIGAGYGAWVLHGWTVRAADYADQGLTTVASPTGTHVVTRGDDSVSPALRAAGWQHVGDPDSYAGYLLDAYQGTSTSVSKLFLLTTPNGARYRYVHPLVPGENYNNSFAAIAPGGRWFVSGEWGTMRRLLVFAMPSVPPGGRAERALPMSSVITLDRPVRDVQGCAFESATTLVCATNDRSAELFGVAQQLLTVHLPHPVDGGPMFASVHLLGPVPGVTACQGTAEVEGIDVHRGRLLVSVVSACTGRTTIFDFRHA
jgi:hypothetical protein